MDHAQRVVEVDASSGEERVLFHTGTVNSPLSDTGKGTLLWSELRRSKFWGQQVDSRICWADLATGRKGVLKDERQAMFPTSLYGSKILYVHYDYDGTYSIRSYGREEPLWTFPLPVSLHGLAADSKTQSIYFIAVDEGGMYIGAWVDNGGKPYIRIVRPASYSTLNDLRAEKGMLYFTSTQSGRDEAHCLDALTGQEWRISTSTYGSFSPAPSAEGTLMTTYTAQGYLLSVQSGNTPRMQVPFSMMPQNVVNPPRVHWDLPLNMDSVRVADTTSVEVKRYRKGTHMFNFHSWAPVAFDPDGIIGERAVNVNAGVTVLSQDLLNTLFMDLRYAWVNGSSRVGAKVQYYGWAPKFELETDWGGGDQAVYSRPSTEPAPSRNAYFDLTGRVFLPLYFDAGYHTRLLQPQVELEHSNALLWEAPGEYHLGINKLMGSLYFSDQVRLATRDFLPRWGYALRGTVAGEPFNRDFSTLWAGYGRVYLPGILPQNSLMVRAAYQWQSGGFYAFRQKEVFPYGADYDINPQQYMAMAVDYQFPVICPDGGIASIVYLKRVRLNLAGYYARYRPFAKKGLAPWQDIWSYGGDIILDTNLLRAPSAATNQIIVSLYHPSDRKGIFVGVNFTIPL